MPAKHGASARPAASYRVEALAKGLRVLSAFSESGAVLTLKEIVELTGIPMPTTFRLAATLEEARFLERLPNGAYRPGLKVLTLGQASLRGSDLVEISRAPLQALADRTGQTVNLGTLTGDRILYLVRLRNGDLVTANIHVGSTLPAVYSSLGKVLLAGLSAHDLALRLAGHKFGAVAGPNAVKSLTALQRQLRDIRAQGYAVQDEEVAAGLRAVAAPVRNQAGEVIAAVNIAVQASEMTVVELLENHLAQVLEVATEISLRLEFAT
jgi:IclR family pca regulon transcriptional regulator